MDSNIVKNLCSAIGPDAMLLINKLDSHDTQLADMANSKITYAKRHAQNMGKFLAKTGQKQPFKVVCQGDSLTYGQDLYDADKVPAMSDPTLDTSVVRNVTQASTTYPQALQNFLNKAYGTGVVTVVNRGVSGHKITDGLSTWVVNPNADITFIMYGANDVNYISIDVYLQNMCTLIERLIDWGSAVIVLTSPQEGVGLSGAFKESLLHLKSIYNVPIFDTYDYIRNYATKEINQWNGSVIDGHFTALGYTVLATLVASTIIGYKNALNPYAISNGTQIPIELSQYGLASDVTLTSSTSSSLGVVANTVDGSVANLGIGKQLTMSVNLRDDNMLLIPLFNVSGANAQAKISVNFGIQQPIIKSSTYFGKADKNSLHTAPNSVYLFDVGSANLNDYLQMYDIGIKIIQIAEKGMHTITVENVGSADIVNFYGFAVYDYKAFSTLVQQRYKSGMSLTQGAYSGLTKYALVSRFRFNANYQTVHYNVRFDIANQANGYGADLKIDIASTTLGVNPTITMKLSNATGLTTASFIAVITKVATDENVIELYAILNASYHQYGYTVTYQNDLYNSVSFFNKIAAIDVLPTGATVSPT